MSNIQPYKGKVVSGAGHMAARMAEGSVAMELYEQEAGQKLAPGTLNVLLESEINIPSNARQLVRKDSNGEAIIYLVPARINDLDCFAVRSKNTEDGQGRHPKNIIELISSHHLRDELDLRDGDSVTVQL